MQCWGTFGNGIVPWDFIWHLQVFKWVEMSEFTQKGSMLRGVGNAGWKYQIKAGPRKSRIFQEENYPNKILKGRKRGAQELDKYFQ